MRGQDGDGRPLTEQLIDKRRIAAPDHFADVAQQLHVSLDALAWRLYNPKWIDDATRKTLRAGQPLSPRAATPKRFSSSFVGLLHRAIDQGRLSARQAAKAMGMSLAQLADLFAEHSLAAPYEL